MELHNWISRLGSEIIPLEINCFQATASSGTNKHVHPGHLHIACFEKGSGICLINDDNHRIRPGDVYLIMPGEIHQFTPQPDAPYQACFFHFSWFGELPGGLPRRIRIPGNERRKFFQLCRQLSAGINTVGGNPGTEFSFYGSLLLFWGELYRLASGNPKVSAPKSGIAKQLKPVIEKLHGPPFFYPGLDVLAEENGLSRRRLTQMFRKYVGCSIKQYYLANVMHYAQTMRNNKQLNSTQLAKKCGYSTVQNFLLAYKKYFSRHQFENSGEVRIWRGNK